MKSSLILNCFRWFLCVLMLSAFPVIISAQSVAINNSGVNPDPSAMLDISSSSKGVLVPRMSSQDRTGISNPSNGLLVFDTTTNTFWFYNSPNTAWREIGTGSGGNMMGPASGDLSGNYPSPNVVKLQNLAIAPGVPNDKQVLKWDNINNTWKGMNDSLFLPYNATSFGQAKLFGITNTNPNQDAIAIYGSSTGSAGVSPGYSVGVWGDNTSGIGVLGSSIDKYGVIGHSLLSHGVFGSSYGSGFAGIFGSGSSGGFGVWGMGSGNGSAILGQQTGSTGKAGIFQSGTETHTDTTLKVITNGAGLLSSFHVNKSTSSNHVMSVSNLGNGDGIRIDMPKIGSFGSGININYQGAGIALKSVSGGSPAGNFSITNPFNTSTVVSMSHLGKGTVLDLNSQNVESNDPTVMVNNDGLSNGMFIQMTNALNNVSGIHVNTAGKTGISVVSAGTAGIQAVANADYAVGVHGRSAQSTNFGIGVLGEGGANDPDAIGVKGVNYSHNETFGAVTGLNKATGVGVYGESTGLDGIGILGLAGVSNSQSRAGQFKNINSSSTKNVLEIINNGPGTNLFINNSHLTNTTNLIHAKNAGTGNFLVLENNLGDIKTKIDKDGDIFTDGNLKVNIDKGIVRSTTTSQMRFEIVPAVVEALGGNLLVLCADCTMERTITFSEPFATPPAVSVGNLLPGGVGFPDSRMDISVKNVTTTGCVLRLHNWSGYQKEFKGTWNLLVIGQD